MDISSITMSSAVIPSGYVSSNTESLPGTSSVYTERTGILASPTPTRLTTDSAPSLDKRSPKLSSILVKSGTLAFLGALVFGGVVVGASTFVVALVVFFGGLVVVFSGFFIFANSSSNNFWLFSIKDNSPPVKSFIALGFLATFSANLGIFLFIYSGVFLYLSNSVLKSLLSFPINLDSSLVILYDFPSVLASSHRLASSAAFFAVPLGTLGSAFVIFFPAASCLLTSSAFRSLAVFLVVFFLAAFFLGLGSSTTVSVASLVSVASASSKIVCVVACDSLSASVSSSTSCF